MVAVVAAEAVVVAVVVVDLAIHTQEHTVDRGKCR